MPGEGRLLRCWGHVWPVALTVCLAFAVRLAYLYETSDVAWRRQLVGDALGYQTWASEICRGPWIGNEPFYQAPLYPYVLAAMSGQDGPTWPVVAILQSTWGALAVGLICLASASLFGRRVGVLAGCMLALYPAAVFFDGIIQKTSLASVLVCLLVAITARSTAKRGWISVFALGVVAALSALTRENLLAWLPILALWLWLTTGERRFRAVGVFALGVAVCLGPVSLRNRAVSGEWSVSTFQAGTNFYIGNHAGASGVYEPLVRGHETPMFERRDATALAEKALARILSASEVSNYWFSKALGEIIADPAGWVRLLGWKALSLWNHYEVADGESLYVYEEFSTVLAALGTVWHWGVLCPLAALGLVATWPDRRRLWIYYALIVTTAASIAMFFILARYRFTLVPLLIPLAAAGVSRTWVALRAGQCRSYVTGLATAGVVAAVVNCRMFDEPRLDAMAQMNLGVALAQAGDLDKATLRFRRAIEGNPDSAEANNNLAMALAVRGDYALAIRHYRAALASDPQLIGVRYNLGVALEHLGRNEEALSEFRAALHSDPNDRDARAAVARLKKSR